MCSLANNVFSNYSFIRIFRWRYFLNDTRLCCVQYHTCLKSPIKIESKFIKEKNLIKSNFSAWQIIRETKYSLVEKTNKLITTVKCLMPSYSVNAKKLGIFWYGTLDELKPQEFFTVFNMADTFFSRFKVIELHVWMLLYHLSKNSYEGKYIRLGVIEAMWEDNEKRARMLDEFNINFKKNFKALNNKFLLSLLLYDDGFFKGDAALSSAVWYCFFNKKNVDPLLLEALVSYIRYQMHHLNKLNINPHSIRETKTTIWVPMKPHVEQILKRC